MATLAFSPGNLSFAEQETASTLSRVQETQRNITVLVADLRKGIEVTGEVIASLTDPRIEMLSSDELLALANSVESLAALRTKLLTKLPTLPLEVGELAMIQSQCERLDSFAETFRMGASSVSRANTRNLIRTANGENPTATRSDWRGFVASLHD